MKIIDKTKLEEQSRRLLSNEVTCMEQLYHPHIVRLYEVIDTFSKLYLVMEVAGNGCLVDRIIRNGKFTEHGARDIFSQVAGAVRYMVRSNRLLMAVYSSCCNVCIELY